MEDEKEIKKEEKVEINEDDVEKAKKIIRAQMGSLNIDDVILTAIKAIAEEVIRRIDTVEIEGNRIRIKFRWFEDDDKGKTQGK